MQFFCYFGASSYYNIFWLYFIIITCANILFIKNNKNKKIKI